MPPKNLESDAKGKRVHSCLHLGTIDCSAAAWGVTLRAMAKRKKQAVAPKLRKTHVLAKSSKNMQINMKKQRELKNRTIKVNFANFFVSL